MGEGAVSRKRFLAVACTGAVGGLAAGETWVKPRQGPDEYDELQGIAGGTIESISLPIFFVRSPRDLVRIIVSPDTRVHNEPSNDIASFKVGETLVAEGEWRDNEFIAAALFSPYRVVKGYVLGTNGARAHTTGGIVRITEKTRLQRGEKLSPVSTTDLAIGSLVTALGELDDASGDLLALRLY